ncbi:MAG: type II secretion system F family protein [candidate division NC10 bacterium]|nr:type II secretion system F family protein [candidate division NC10 bacterium]
MPDFAYKACDEQGEKVKGVLAAQDEEHLADLLSAQGLYLLRSAKPRRLTQHPWFQRPVRRRDLVLLFVHLATALTGGISLLEALRTYADESGHERLRTVARGIANEILAGTSFSDAMAGYPAVFAPVFVSMVRAGETTGHLDKVLQDLVSFLEWQEALAGTVKQALTYPIVLLGALVGLITLLVGYVFPQLLPVFQKVRMELPLPTRLLIAVSTALRQYWFLGLLLIVGVVTAMILYIRTPLGRLQFDRWLLRTPVVGGIARRIALSRFARYLSVLYMAGVEFIQSLQVVERLVGNRVIEFAVREAREEVIAGSLLSAALKRTGAVPSLVVQMVATGETTGKMDETLQKVSQYYDREVQESVKRATALIEPAAIIVMAGMVLFVALSIFLPLWGMIGQISRR